MSESPSEPEPHYKVFTHSVTAYAELLKKSRKATEGSLFEGSFRAIFRDCDELPLAYYQRCRTVLSDLGCIEMLRQGHGQSPSLIRLAFPPTPELYNERLNSYRKATTTHKEMTDQRLRDMAKRIKDLEADVRTLYSIVQFGKEGQP